MTSTKIDDVPGKYYYHPVMISQYALNYSGDDHKILRVNVNTSGPAGLFGSIAKSGAVIQNIELVDFEITTGTQNAATDYAGALVGHISQSAQIKNVLAHNTSRGVSKKIVGAVAGGLVGVVNDPASIDACAAALYVEGSSFAGGLVGQVNPVDGASGTASIKRSYAGGHTNHAAVAGNESPTKPYLPSGDSANPLYDRNVYSSGGTAGGLIGSAVGTAVESCYSTCSADGRRTPHRQARRPRPQAYARSS